ncbi:hypothetical protein PG994_004246 [Apiospora phragmitis]|uniref:Uncharacterized protein n=1 Tax=Apiospora phragmitis TaxID=2905665 RepID=A0ABR1VQB3_9PEZI
MPTWIPHLGRDDCAGATARGGQGEDGRTGHHDVHRRTGVTHSAFCIYKATVPGTLLAMFCNPDKLYDIGDAGLVVRYHRATAWCRPCYASCAISCRVSCHAEAQARRTGDWFNLQETAGAGSGHIAHHERKAEDTVSAMPTDSLFADRTAGGNGANGQRGSRWDFGA